MVTRDELIAALEPDEVDYDRIVRFIGADALPMLPELIDGDRLDLAAKATSLAGLLVGDQRLPVLDQAARSPHAVVRIAAAAAAESVSATEAEQLVPLLLDDKEPSVRKLAVRAAAPIAQRPPVRAALDRIATDDPVHALRDAVVRLPTDQEGAAMPSDDDIVQRAIAKFGPVLDLRANPQALIDIVRASRVSEPGDGGLPPGGVPEPPPGPTSMQVGEATLDDVMAEVLRLSRRLSEATNEIVELRNRLG